MDDVGSVAPPPASNPAVRLVMQGNRKRNTRPEMALRRSLHALGLRFRVACRPLANLSRTADIVFASPRLAVFLDGCFWHGCPDHFSQPSTNQAYWAWKINRNRLRDAEVDAALLKAGWRAARVWEHEDPLLAAERIAALVRSAR